MPDPSSATVTRLLDELQNGNRSVLSELFSLVYDELLTEARKNRAQWHGDYTLNTTALVHEAYIKLANQGTATWESRSHFLAVAAGAMRHILIDYAKARRTQKRGGDARKVSLDEMQPVLEHIAFSEEQSEAIVVLGEALRRLEKVSESESKVVECRVFGGMTVKETAEALGVSPSTVKRDWAMAQAWLYREMQRELHLGGADSEAGPL